MQFDLNQHLLLWTFISVFDIRWNRVWLFATLVPHVRQVVPSTLYTCAVSVT